MKRDRQSVDLRHAEMLSYIRERQEVKVEELAKSFGVSSMTVRRDLQMLEARGQISRTHGGATADPRTAPVLDEQDEVALCRRLIACRAAALIRERCAMPGASVHFLVGGTQTNRTVIVSLLRPHQGVVSADSGHIAVHETGAIENGGHKGLQAIRLSSSLTSSENLMPRM